MSVHSHEAASDETDRLCDDTIELIGSFGRMLAKARAARTAAAASPACPCGRSVERHQQNHNPRPRRAVSSNASNLDDAKNIQQPAGRVLTSPNEIRLLLRLESWIGDNGTLVVKPSLHREQLATIEGCNFGNNSTLQPAQGQIYSDSFENAADDICAGCGDGCDGDCCEANEDEQLELAQVAPDPVEQPAEHRQQRRLQKLRKETQPPPELSAVSIVKPSRQQLLQQRRERLQAKRSASATKASSSGKAVGSSRTRRDLASVPASDQQQQQSRRKLSRGGAADSTSLIEKLYRLLSAEMKQSG